MTLTASSLLQLRGMGKVRMRPSSGTRRSGRTADRLSLATFRRKIDVLGARSMGFGRAKTAGPPGSAETINYKANKL
jgi:hypothetical protein